VVDDESLGAGAHRDQSPNGRDDRCGTGREMGLLAADEFVNKKLIRVGA
jgi:succinate-semialdehyde dehydrogenase/glutarate-semialdehyde dehydrogenase